MPRRPWSCSTAGSPTTSPRLRPAGSQQESGGNSAASSTAPSGSPPAAHRRRGERALSLEFLRDQPLPEFALAMFNLNGFLYVP